MTYTTEQLRNYDRKDVDAMLAWAADEIDRLKRPIEALEKWNGKGKPFWLRVDIDDGYGATGWQCDLYKLREKIVGAIEAPDDELEDPFVSSEEDDYEGFLAETAAGPRTLWVRSMSEPDEWPGLARVILAAYAAAEKIMENKKDSRL